MSLRLNLEGSSNKGNYKIVIISHFRCSIDSKSLMIPLSGLEPQSSLSRSWSLFDLIIVLLILSGTGSL